MLVFGFLSMTLLSFLFFYYGTGRDKRVLLYSLLWLIIIGVISRSGFFQNTTELPPRFLWVILGAASLGIHFYRKLKSNPIHTHLLTLIHTLRFPVEIGLYHLFLQGLVPKIMTFYGWNFDIVIGISAILTYFFAFLKKNKLPTKFLLIWNIIGLASLTFIVFIAILSAPLPIQQLAFDQPNVAVLNFPFIFLPAYIVPIVYASHLLSINKLLSSSKLEHS